MHFLSLDESTALACADNRYVGKADGLERILGRWTAYARGGHGGNIALRDLAGGASAVLGRKLGARGVSKKHDANLSTAIRASTMKRTL